ncbi:MAG: DUF2393 family protein [Campylobacteraceae bacterium]|nr:DUF2393 family protein [Campylobacteraceae bacterium]
MTTHLTILHWIALFIIAILFILVLILTLRNNDGKFPLSAILTNIFAMTILTFFMFYGLDKFTKLAKLENVVQKKVLINESFSISGQIRNVGNFTIGQCTLEVKISSDSLERNSDGPLFLPKSVLDDLFKKEAPANAIETTKEFVIAEDLQAGEMRNFSVFMRYPPSFVKPYTRYELFCH